METAIAWFYNRLGKVYYSMATRNGQVVGGRPNYDCSSAVYYSLIEQGRLPANHRIGNTDTLFGDLERNGWTQVPEINGSVSAQRGDVFIWGKRGASGGGAGHTGLFVNANDIIHCAYGYNGIHVDNHDWLSSINGYPELTVYRYTSAPAPVPYAGDTDQNVDVGSIIRFDNTYIVDEILLIDNLWQVRTSELCSKGFTWADNGIPAEPLWEVDADGYATGDQSLDPGSRYKIEGKFTVLDLGESDGLWMAQIEWKGLKFWVDIATATEIKSSDAGTPVPATRPTTAPPVTQEPVPTPEPVTEPTPTPVPLPDEPKPTTPITPPKEDNMAFPTEDQKQLKIATEKVQDLVDEIATTAAVQEIISGVSKRVKFIVYLIGDTLIGLGLLTPGIAAALEFGTVNQIAALSGVFATAGAFILTMFGIYKNNK